MEVSDLLNWNLESITPGLAVLIIAIMIWKLIWYGLALYKSVQKQQKRWFVVLFVAAFVLNDLGILAIIYLILNKKKKGSSKAKKKPKKKRK